MNSIKDTECIAMADRVEYQKSRRLAGTTINDEPPAAGSITSKEMITSDPPESHIQGVENVCPDNRPFGQRCESSVNIYFDLSRSPP